MADMTWNAKALVSTLQRKLDSIVKTEADNTLKRIKSSFASGNSAPGQAPARQSGELERGLKVEKSGQSNYLIGVEDKQEGKALALELGSRGVAPRPFIRPQEKPALKALKKAVQKEL